MPRTYIFITLLQTPSPLILSSRERRESLWNHNVVSEVTPDGSVSAHKRTSAPGWVPRDRRECDFSSTWKTSYNPLRKILAREYIDITNVVLSDTFTVPIWKHFATFGNIRPFLQPQTLINSMKDRQPSNRHRLLIYFLQRTSLRGTPIIRLLCQSMK